MVPRKKTIFKKLLIKYTLLVYLPILVFSWILVLFIVNIFIYLNPTDILVGLILGSGFSFIFFTFVLGEILKNRMEKCNKDE